MENKDAESEQKNKRTEEEERKKKEERSQAQPGPVYDAVFRYMAERMKRLMILLVNNLFGTDYEGDEELIYNPSEGTKPDSGSNKRQIQSDSHFTIVSKDGQREAYHIECQGKKDGAIVDRIVEYDMMLGFRQSVMYDDEIILDLMVPKSAIILLRSKRSDNEAWKYRFRDGHGVFAEREIAVLSIPETPLDDLFRKKLYALLPFFLFTNGDDIKKLSESPEGRQKLMEQSVDVFNRISNEKDLSEEEKIRLLELITEIIPAVIRDEQLTKEMTDIMFPQRIELEIDRYGDAREAEGRAEGRAEGEARGIILTGLLAGMPRETIVSLVATQLGLTPEKAESVYEQCIDQAKSDVKKYA